MTSSSGSPEITAEPANPPWNLTGSVPDKPSICDYGYVVRGNAIGSTREELIKALVSRGPGQIKLAWTPETPHPVFPDKIPLLAEAFQKITIREAWKNIGWGSALVALGVVLGLVLQDWKFLYRNLLSVFGALAVAEGVWELWRSRRYDQEEVEATASSLRFDAWIGKKHISGYTFTLCAWIVIVGAAQAVSFEDSITRAALVKPAVWQGEWWRLFTACLMHGSFMHFWMNFLILLHFARIVENTIHRAYVPLIFFVSAAAGSIFSVLLYPHTTSVGASGGLMGLFGFITTAAYFDRDRFPPKYLRRSLEGIAFVGMFGLIGFEFVDNAAHLGGLCGGLALGWLFRPQREDVLLKVLSERISTLSTVVLVLLGILAAVAVTKILGYW